MSATKKAVILLSGGLDSATVLAMARDQGYVCHTLAFNYGQRHQVEIAVSAAIAKSAQVTEHRVVTLDVNQFGGSSLTDTTMSVPTKATAGIPNTYVPARNTIFLSIALGYAEAIRSHDLFIGVNAVDYSGYPDCRPEYIQAFETMANLATRDGVEGQRFTIHTPLIDLTKADIVTLGTRLGVDYSQTVSCYQADEQGHACGVCDACRLRKAGFEQAGLIDPTRYQ